MKAKFDSAQLKSFLLNHVEKIVFAGFILAFVMICTSAFKLKPYEKKPDELKSLAERISQEVEAKAPPDQFTDLPSVPNFSNLGAVGPALVDARFFSVEPLSLPYELRQERRKEPKFFALEEPLAFPGYGGIAINESGGVVNLAGASGDGMDMPGMYSSGVSGPTGPNSMGMDYAEQQRRMGGGVMPPDSMMSGMGQSGMMPGMQGMGVQGPMGPTGPRRGRAARKPKTPKKEVAKPTPPPKPQITEKIVISQTPPNSHVEGRYWICLVGVIPYWQQFTEYQNTFRDARYYQPTRDFPRYVFPRIERAEVNGGEQGDWEEVNVEEAVDYLRKWGAEYPDTALDKRFFDPDLTWPLPPLVFANHDKEKIVHPKTKIEEKPRTIEADESKKPRARSLTDLGRQQANPRGGNAGRMSGSGQMGGQYSGYGPRGASGMGGMGGMMGPQNKLAGPLTEHRLFRFFDFTVKPGKTYTYRIKLVLRNPNYRVPPRFLDNYDYAKGDSREADWSKPSPPTSVIAGNRLLAGGVTISPGKGEPTGQVLAKLFDAKEAAEVRKVFEVGRGAVLNKHEAEIGLPDPASPSKKVAAKVDIETNAVVLDMFGGDKLANAKSSKVPGHILVLDNDGEMRALLQASDANVFETEKTEADNQAPPKEDELAKPGGPAGGPGGSGFDNFENLESKPRRRR